MAPLAGRRAFWTLQVGGWGAFAGVYALASLPVLPLSQAILGKLVFGASGFALSLLLAQAYRRLRARGASGASVVALGGLACYVGGVAWANMERWGLAAAGLEPWPASRWLTTRGALFYATVLVAWSALYFVILAKREVEANRQEAERQRQQALLAQSLAREAQLRALRYQLNPHFLFNALNAISTLVAEGRAEAANATLARLADFLRATLDGTEAEVTLEKELSLVDGYLSVERARLQERLQASLQAEPGVLDAMVPALLLQPLVENAVRHGVAQRRQGGRVEVWAEAAGRRLRVVVRDDGPGAVDAAPSLGFGLANTEERLRHLFDDDFRLDLRPSALGGTEVVVEMPLRRRPPAVEKGAA
jgi:two-component system, LytTR family, sensor kinase